MPIMLEQDTENKTLEPVVKQQDIEKKDAVSFKGKANAPEPNSTEAASNPSFKGKGGKATKSIFDKLL